MRIATMSNVIDEENKILRKLLWMRHGCPSHALYGDDGELQCSKCLIDFKRAPAEAIERQFLKINTPEILAFFKNRGK